MRWLSVIAVLALLSGCATLSEGDCATGDWREIGRNDGLHGLQRSQLAKHQEACAEYGVRPDVRAYDAGRRSGLRAYCTPDKGFLEGREGRTYRGVCTPPDERGFLDAYREGKIIYAAREALKDVDQDITRKENLIKDDDTGTDERSRLRRELRKLRHDRSRLQRDLDRDEQHYGRYYRGAY